MKRIESKLLLKVLGGSKISYRIGRLVGRDAKNNDRSYVDLCVMQPRLSHMTCN